jgi:F420H(2)-dependent biliverdin reductase
VTDAALPDGFADRLATEQNIWMATTRPDGRPHVTPVWFVWLQNRFWIGTYPKAVKVTNLRANPAMSACLEDGNRPVVAEGRATIHDDVRGLPLPVIAAFQKKYDWSLADEAGGLVVVEMAVTRWIHPGGA